MTTPSGDSWYEPGCRRRTSGFTDTSGMARRSTRAEHRVETNLLTQWCAGRRLTQWCAGRRWYSKISPLIAQNRNPTPMSISHHNRNAVATATSEADSAKVNGQ